MRIDFHPLECSRNRKLLERTKSIQVPASTDFAKLNRLGNIVENGLWQGSQNMYQYVILAKNIWISV